VVERCELNWNSKGLRANQLGKCKINWNLKRAGLVVDRERLRENQWEWYELIEIPWR
jgi:hypothetical protein